MIDFDGDQHRNWECKCVWITWRFYQIHEHIRSMIMHVWMLWNAWWLALYRHDFAETGKTLEYWARNGSRSDIYLQKFLFWGCRLFEDIPRPLLEAGNCKIVEEDSLNGIAACWNSHINTLDIASVVNASCMFVFPFSFLLLSSHFCLDRPFGFSTHRGNKFFSHAPVFAWIAFEGCQSIGVLIFA